MVGSKKLTKALFSIFLLSTSTCFAEIKIFYFEKSSNPEADIEYFLNSNKIFLTHKIDGYEANCRKNYLLVWGKPKIFNSNNPQDSSLTIINLEHRSPPLVIGFSKNIFDVSFSDDEYRAIIESDTQNIINITNGKIQETENFDESIKEFKPESCSHFKNKSYRKFKE